MLCIIKKKKTKNIVLWAYTEPQLYRHQRGSRFWSRHVLLSWPKLQNTNCTDVFSTSVTRHKQETSSCLRTANNTIVKCSFKFMPLVSVSFHQSCPSFDGMRSIDNTSRQVLLRKESDLHCNDSTNLLSLATSANAYLESILSIVNIPFEHFNFSLTLQPHSPIKPEWSDLWDLNFDWIQFSGFRS